ncbi:elongation factor P--(R)-beta-lysine ligase [Idiomarina seosinensis]|uniref:Elongation factor P lysine(34) lysyltransferase n=1 Tax=Idiomarina seosinensis TaxID=281739 RepID=A0A432Z7F8_9GAMM|nr:elongation factor P--(R)-beta-lysine ligase [Idiomarina seosinensis]RUO73775.1 elongation factor P lysine(34) lysyltransferase [Idiomarina seosinensis]
MNDSNWRSAATLDTLRYRAKLMGQVRQFFEQRDVLEVDTPTLARAGVTDLYLENLTSRLAAGADGQPMTLHLQTSPEFALKRLIAQHHIDVYQLSHVFRDDEIGRFHNPEFSLLEWYRLGLDTQQLIQEISELLTETTAAPPVQALSYQQAFIHYCEADPLTADGIAAIHQQLLARDDTQQWMQQESDTDTILQVAFNLLVEPRLDEKTPIAITNFPASQAALAQLSEDDPRVAHRFEIYYQGVELANGYKELTDATAQQQRFEHDNRRRQEQGKPVKQLDFALIEALKHGLPDCSGVALGFDRLLMIALGAKHIKEVLPFSIESC